MSLILTLLTQSHCLFLGGRFNVRGRTGNDNSGILTCTEDSNEIHTENIREEPEGIDKDPGNYVFSVYKLYLTNYL